MSFNIITSCTRENFLSGVCGLLPKYQWIIHLPFSNLGMNESRVKIYRKLGAGSSLPLQRLLLTKKLKWNYWVMYRKFFIKLIIGLCLVSTWAVNIKNDLPFFLYLCFQVTFTFIIFSDPQSISVWKVGNFLSCTTSNWFF